MFIRAGSELCELAKVVCYRLCSVPALWLGQLGASTQPTIASRLAILASAASITAPVAAVPRFVPDVVHVVLLRLQQPGARVRRLRLSAGVLPGRGVLSRRATATRAASEPAAARTPAHSAVAPVATSRAPLGASAAATISDPSLISTKSAVRPDAELLLDDGLHGVVVLSDASGGRRLPVGAGIVRHLWRIRALLGSGGVLVNPR